MQALLLNALVQFTSCTAFLTIFPHLSHYSAGLKARCAIKCTIFIHSPVSSSLCAAVMTTPPPSPHGVIEQRLILLTLWLQVEKLHLQTCLTSTVKLSSLRCLPTTWTGCASVCERTGRVTLCVFKGLWVKVGQSWEKKKYISKIWHVLWMLQTCMTWNTGTQRAACFSLWPNFPHKPKHTHTCPTL